MPFRVAFDLDGTVADMHSALQKVAIQLFGEEALKKAAPKKQAPAPPAKGGKSAPAADPAVDPAAAVIDELHLTAAQQRQLWEHVKSIENFWTTLSELEPGIIARIARTAHERRWEVIFFTTRPSTAGDLTQIQSQRWLANCGFEFPSVYVVHRSRGRIAEALQLDAFVDDRPENCLDIAVESQARVILIWQGDPQDIPPGAKRMGVRPVQTISEAIALLERLDDARNKPGIVRSIKRALGSNPDL